MKILMPLFFLFFVPGLEQEIHAQLPCATDEVHQRLLQTNPAYKKAIEYQDAKWVQYNTNITANVQSRLMNEDDVYEIPVVIHVIHTGQAIGTTYNPSDSTLIAKIANLNAIFAANYNTGNVNTTGSVNIPIRFKLAKRTPDCLPTNGINRVNGSAVPGYSMYGVSLPGSGNPGADETAIMSLASWTKSSYLNIWIVTQIQGAGGYAGIDRVFIDAATVGEYILAHEVGHFLGLLHTFEGSSGTNCPTNNNCTNEGDRVCDTEPHYLTGCQTGINPCTNQPWGSVIRNFMNYSNNGCQGIFTAGQKERMLFALDYWNSSLLTSLGGLPPGIDPVIIPPPVTACVPTGIVNSGNTAGIGPTRVRLADLDISNSGYNSAIMNNQFYVDHTIPPLSSCLQQQSQTTIAHLTMGQPYTITVNTEFSQQNVRGWIDFNNDGTFQPSELIISSNGQINGDETHTASFTVPTTGMATCTSLRMRIGADAFGYPAPQPCANLEFGQVEDFIVIVQEPAIPLPSVNIAANTTNLICAGTNVTFTATPVNGGSNPAYQWKKNGMNVGSNSNVYSSNSLANEDIISCVMTTSAACPAYPLVPSNLVTMKVSPSPPSVTISVFPAASICEGAYVTFKALPVNSGSNPAYQWKKNGVNVGVNSIIYTTNDLASGDIITCVMTILETCPATQTVASNGITMNIGSPPSGAVIIPSPVSACLPTGLTGNQNYYTGPTTVQLADLLVNNGGYADDGYLSYIDHTIAAMPNCIQNQPVAHLNPGATYTVTVITDDLDLQNVRGWIDYNNDGIFQPSELIISSNGTTSHQTHTASFTVPATGVPTCASLRMRISADLAYGNPAPQPCSHLQYGQAEDFIVIIKDPAIPAPSVSIAANPTGAVCQGTNVVFTATPVSGGTNPSYQWKLNGNNVGANSNTYSNNTLANGDVVSCIMTSSELCATTRTATGNNIIMVVNSVATPTITAGGPVTFCNGANVVFTSSAASGNQWFKDGNTIAGQTGTTYTATTSGSYTVRVTNASNCSATSAATVVTVNANPAAPTITAGGPVTFCNGANVVLTSSAATGNQWIKDGTDITGQTGTAYTATTSGSYTVRVTNASSCTAISVAAVVTVNAVPAKPTITQAGNQLLSSAASGNQWFKDGVAVAGATGQTYTPVTSGNYTVQVTVNGCSSLISDAMNVIITAINDPALQNGIKIFPNPVKDVINITNNRSGKITIQLYDLAGRKIAIKEKLAGTYQLAVARLMQGCYILLITDERTKKSFTKLLFKE